MKRDEVHERLRAAGQSPAPGADPTFAATLEQRLRAVHHSLPLSLPDSLPGATEPRSDAPTPAPGRPWFRSPIPVAAMALLVVLSLPLVLRGPQPAGVELLAAHDTRVTLPDGRTVVARAGLMLEDGAVVLTGPRGSAQADGVVLGSGEVAVVQDGALQRVERGERRPPDRTVPSEPPARSPAPPLGGLPALPGQSPRPSPPPKQPAQDRPSAQPTQDGDGQDRTAARPDQDEQPHVGQAEPDAGHAIGLALRGDPRAVHLVWTEFDHPDFAFFAVLRAPYPSVPRWPMAKGTEVVGYTPDRTQRQFTDDDVDYRPVYRVVALDRSGNELGRSGAVTPPFEQVPSRPEAKRAGPFTYTY